MVYSFSFLVLKTSFAARLSQSVARSCANVVMTSYAMVLAGSGNKEALLTLEMIRMRHSEDMDYGSHMAWNMSVGLIFLGSGTCSIGSSRKATAALFCSFFPIYPSSVADNRYHLQALRHLWTLAIERRCLLTRDVQSGELECVPIQIVLKNQLNTVVGESISTYTPCLLPELSTIDSIRVLGPR